MKVVILAGGLGTRLSEETVVKPKPIVEIGGKPMLWHIMNIYAAHGFNEFIIALGYKGELIKEYFINYTYRQSDISIDLKTGKIQTGDHGSNDWLVHLVDTGVNSMTGGRLHRLRDRLKGSRFMLTYGDGVGDIDIRAIVEFHKSHGRIATLTVVRPSARFGEVKLNGHDGEIIDFKEKPQTGEGWINGGFFVFEPEIFDYLHGDETVLEADPLESLARDRQLMAYKHGGFWQCMDTLRDKQLLERLWESGNAKWKIWR
ncbi:MAG: glucose-1-phosphate cytidylyltransferase [Deltaproteobacteria bacterium]|nr:glucose-1-phosphate cytidylyltransferase [Deltaproteobacteria bacterium]